MELCKPSHTKNVAAQDRRDFQPGYRGLRNERSRPLLFIEVASSSLRYDLNAKASLYAEAGVPEYWVLNLVDRELVVFRTPQEGDYRDRATYRSGDRVVPEAWEDVVIEVSELFPTEEPS